MTYHTTGAYVAIYRKTGFDTQVYMDTWMHFRIQIGYRFGYKGRYR